MKKHGSREKEPAVRDGSCCCDESAAEDHLRCPCGSLLARFVDGQIELKCRRCKRTVMVPIEGATH